MRILYLGLIIALTVLVGFFGFQAYALWVPLSTQQLLEQSKTIFVGNITAVTPVDVQYQSQIARNGTVKQSVGPETMTLDEYTVHVEEFLQNPQGYDTINLRQATVGGVPSGPSTIGGFEVGDRVMFFLPKYENQTRFPMQYLPESFKIPQFCNGQDVLAQKRIIGSNNFTVIQNGLKVDYGNFTVNKPIKFLYDKDMNTLFGKRFDVAVGISKANDRGNLAVFSQEIHAGTKPCQWVTSAAWEFTPREDGKYIMTIITKEGNGTGGMSQTPFYVKSDTSVINHKLPLEQFKSGAPASNVKCNDGLQLIIKAEDGSPACVKLDDAYILIKRGWATSESAYPGGDAQFAMETNSTIMPAHLPRSSGLQIPYYKSSRVTNYSGFDGVYNETFLYRGTQKDYVLKPGSTGVITFKLDAGASELKGQDNPIPLPKSLNLTNYAVFYHEITSLEDLSKYPGVTFDNGSYGHFRACSAGPAGEGTCIGGPFGGTNQIEAFVTDHPGVDVLFEPPSEMLPLGMNATSQAVTMMITADSNAPRGTYLVEIPSIGSDSFLLTVGNRPYHE